MSETFYQVVGCIGFALMIAAIIAGARFVARIRNQARARSMTPLARAIDGRVEHSDANQNPVIVARHEGRALRAFASPQVRAGRDDTSLVINEFSVRVAGVAGDHGWVARFHVTGLLGQGTRKLHIETREESLGQALVGDGLLEVLEAFCSPSADYAAASYDVHTRTLTLTDDVQPKIIPTAERFRRQALLAIEVASLTERHYATRR